MSVERQAPKWSGAARMLGAAMIGMEKAMFGEKDERPGVIVDAPGEPPNDLPFEIRLDTEHPERSAVVFHATDSEPPAVN